MLSSSESDFEINTFEKYKSDEISSENKLSDSLRERFSKFLPYQFELENEKNAEEALCFLSRLKSRSSRFSMDNCSTISHTCKPYQP